MSDWSPVFISPAPAQATERVVRLRKRFPALREHGEIISAVVRGTALGVLEMSLNGAPTSSDVLSPGWTSYEWRLRYLELSVLDLIADENVFDVRLAAGWYAGALTWENQRNLYGDRTAAAVEIRIVYADGYAQTIATDESWLWAPDRTVTADLYNGQVIDARIEDPVRWGNVTVLSTPDIRFEPYTSPTIRRQDERSAERVWRSPSGKLLVDFGQNLVGWARLSVIGEQDTEIKIRHAEELEHGELAVIPLRGAEATDTFILSGGPDVFEPTFTFHGFRYAEVTGWPGRDADLEQALRAVVVSSDLRQTGSFRSSDVLLNRFHENVVWGMRGNFLDVPTDCPQRDERLGWTGDIAAFAPTAAFLFDVQDFLSNWLRDVHAETVHANGIVPFVVPNPLKLLVDPIHGAQLGSSEPTAVWSDAAVWVPWALYEHDGDVARLRQLYDLMALHASSVADVLQEDGTWGTGFQFGDWLDPAAPPEDAAAAITPTPIVATASAFRTFDIMRRAANALGRFHDVDHYTTLSARVRDGFRSAYVDHGVMSPATPTGYTLAIAFGILEGEELEVAGNQLATLVRANGHRIATGFAGTPFITDALTRTGHVADAYELLLQRACPSWLYPVTMGATTVWERWDSKLPDGSVNPGGMTSFNHYALGSVADWIHRTVGGVAPLEPGYRRVLVAPRPDERLTWCETSLRSPAGDIVVRWEIRGDELSLHAELPAPGILRLPGRPDEEVSSGTHDRLIPWSARDSQPLA